MLSRGELNITSVVHPPLPFVVMRRIPDSPTIRSHSALVNIERVAFAPGG